MVLAVCPLLVLTGNFVFTKCKVMDYLVCGSDLSKDQIDFAFCSGSSKVVFGSGLIPNDAKNIKKFINKLKSFNSDYDVWVCCEHTGNYGLLFISLLIKHGIKVAVMSSLEIIRSSGISRGKSDPIDARRISLFGAVNFHKLKSYELPEHKLLKIKSLLSIRDLYVKTRTSYKNALKSHTLVIGIVDLKKELKSMEKQISNLNKLILETEKQISNLIQADDEIGKSFGKIVQVTGIGLICAANILVTTNNFKSFDNARKFNCYCGMAPFPHSSGSSVKRKSKTSKLRNRNLKKLLFSAVTSAIVHDNQLKTYYKRKKAEGKATNVVKNAVACKLISRVFAVVKREEPFLKLEY